ncbi:hypothetical protein Rumeso_02417 [Rubellimicrobium mesophilum DSM 19309]|uniref:Uncharacterized protein n=1 Tax=Rubellimicrobium mesophilum DSM 19309 TaxID=442562 RepID=A0A017HPA6_9RHOB|nr:hypothetical protein Rumeso_02417 [Rubellimicrobium mesophilum DSM 19309]
MARRLICGNGCFAWPVPARCRSPSLGSTQVLLAALAFRRAVNLTLTFRCHPDPAANRGCHPERKRAVARRPFRRRAELRPTPA